MSYSRVVVLSVMTVFACAGCGGKGTSQDQDAPLSASYGKAETTRSEAEEKGSHSLGEPRDDLERFYGVYGDAANSGRNFFVTRAVRPQYAEQAEEIPPGYLMIGAVWGDVAPWPLKTVSETKFEQAWVPDYAPEAIVVEFELGENGKAVALTFQSGFEDRGRLERLGDLPEEWQ